MRRAFLVVPIFAGFVAACASRELPDPAAVPAPADAETDRARALAVDFLDALVAGDGGRAWELADETRAVPLLVYVAGEGPVGPDDFLRAEAIGESTLAGFGAGLAGAAPASADGGTDLEATEPPSPWVRYWVFRVPGATGVPPLPVGVGLDAEGATLVDVAGLFSVLRPDALAAFAADLPNLPDDIVPVVVAAQRPSATVIEGDVWEQNLAVDLAATVHHAALAFLDAADAVSPE